MKEFVEKLKSRLEEKTLGKPTAQEFNNGIYSAIKIINELAEEYNNGWIDYEKEIPKENGWYWGYYVTSSYIDKNGVEHRECKYASIYWEDNLWLYDPRGFRTVDRVIAWQHIPEYYKPHQEWKNKVMKHFTNVE